MKIPLLLLCSAVLIAACGKDTTTSSEALSEQMKLKPSQFIPPLEEITSGQFDEIGMAAVFEKVSGQVLPANVIPLSGNYKVYNEDRGRGKNSRSYEAYFQMPPDDAEKLLNIIEGHWERQYGAIPDWKVHKSRFGAKDFGVVKTTDSAVLISVSNSYVYYRELYRAIIDPTTGDVVLLGVNDRNESPADRQVEEDNARMDKERMDEERRNKDR